MMNKNLSILIVGLGLIGGSYAKGLKKQGFSVLALDNNPESIEYALKHHIIDEGSTDSIALIQKADVIISALYPQVMIEWIKNNQVYFKKNIYITDVSGVKQNVVDVIQSFLRDDVEFISAHPMAGREVYGVQNSDETIFYKANYIVTPTAKNTEAGISFAKDLGQELKFARITELSLKEHDKMIGFLSQLTHVIAVSLMNTMDNTHLKEYTGDSFRDLTRIAKINENLWSELFFLNKDFLLEEIEAFETELDHFKQTLLDNDIDEMKRLFIQSTNRRKEFDK